MSGENITKTKIFTKRDDNMLGLVSISFRKNSPSEIVAEMKKSGLINIEWGSDVHAPCDDLENLKNIKKLCDDNKITCSSYGTYFKIGVTPDDEITKYIDAAKILGTNILRLWCGTKKSADYTSEEKEELFSKCKTLAKIAEKENVVLCMECHPGSYTETLDGAIELMDAIDSENFKMYWQPNQFTTETENFKYAETMAKHTKIIHVFNWTAEKWLPLSGGIEIWKKYLAYFDGTQKLLLEFMPDNRIESLETESSALKEIAKGVAK